VNSGAIALERNAKWLSPNVTVNGGMLIVRPSAATNTFGVGRATETDLFVNGDGRLELQSAAYTSTVNSITFDGVLLRRGVYTAENCPFITGEGALHAVHGHPTGVIIIVR
jgi:L-aminopeptidase/D-esterase-like protein